MNHVEVGVTMFVNFVQLHWAHQNVKKNPTKPKNPEREKQKILKERFFWIVRCPLLCPSKASLAPRTISYNERTNALTCNLDLISASDKGEKISRSKISCVLFFFLAFCPRQLRSIAVGQSMKNGSRTRTGVYVDISHNPQRWET